ncbi:MAG: hypothetical protein ABSE42_11645 [Bryobacteraceae bacterium]|jgi:hypothetical protein
MRLALTILLALAPLSAQVARPVPAAARESGALPTAPPRVSLTSLATIARSFDRSFQMFAPTDPIDVLGRTRGIYLEGFGAVFTTELDLILTPRMSPFRPTITEAEKTKVRQRKQARLPAMEGLMNTLLQSAAKDLTAVPEDQQVVVVVQLLYLPYEDSSGLPGQIVVKASRRAILSGAQIVATVSNQ